jgi:hypothetical protein
MKFSAPIRWLPAYQWLAGLCDTSTGVMLVFAPAWTLRVMGLHQLPSPIEFVSFVGAFVLSVGLAYFYAARWPMNSRFAPRWQTVWFLTALSRSFVAMFLTWQIIAGKMEIAWLTVAFTDGALATVQWIGLKLGWLNFKD